MSQNDEDDIIKLPSYKLALDKQILMLKIIFEFNEKHKLCDYKTIAKKLLSHQNTVSNALQFWKYLKIINLENKSYVPSSILIDFVKTDTWNVDDPWKMLGNIFNDAWFMRAIESKFNSKPHLSYNELLETLGYASKTSKRTSDIDRSLKVIITILEKIGLIEQNSEKNYILGTKLPPSKRTIVIDKNMVQIQINDELYAMDSDDLKEFIISNGNKLDKKIQRLD